MVTSIIQNESIEMKYKRKIFVQPKKSELDLVVTSTAQIQPEIDS